MCGINGVVSKAKNENLQRIVSKMNSLIFHRGPDDNGIWNDGKNVSMGMQRLSIIDLETGKQPMFSDDGNLIIVFNGEIYNFLILREALEANGIVFRTKSDTEVVLRLFELEGIKFVDKLNGMFSFVIFDRKQNKLTIARDRVGEKPLYYYWDEELFIWASELKSLVSAYSELRSKKFFLSKEAINLFFSLTFIPAPHTIYQDVFKLEPASYISFDLTLHTFEKKRYWDIDLEKKDDLINYQSAQKKLKELLYKSVELRMISDVPIGVFLSGGVDSSIVTAIMADIKNNQKIDTFSIGFKDKRFDESEKAKLVSKHCGTNHHPILLEFKEVKEDVNKVILNYDEPFGDSSAIPTYWVSKTTRAEVKVALTGDGGDEVFGGYNRYLMGSYSALYKKYIPLVIHENLFKPLINNLVPQYDNRKSVFYRGGKFINSISSSTVSSISNIISLGFSEQEKSNLLIDELHESLLTDDFVREKYNKVKDESYLTQVRYIDKEISLDGDMLVKVDRASMLASLECRAPFLDHNLFEFANSLPDNFLIDGSNKKKILKDAFAVMLPKGLFNLQKNGFGIPVGSWLKNELKEDLMLLTDMEFLKTQNIFKPTFVESLFQEHLGPFKDHTIKLWLIYCFQKWYLFNINNINHNKFQ